MLFHIWKPLSGLVWYYFLFCMESDNTGIVRPAKWAFQGNLLWQKAYLDTISIYKHNSLHKRALEIITFIAKFL